MRIAFYAPLKSVDHPVPSGDREMGRALIKALEASGHEVPRISALRSFLPTPDRERQAALSALAEREIAAIAAQWGQSDAAVPSLWFTYHNYHKAPDLLGPALSRRFGLPYVIAEASHAAKRKWNWARWYEAATTASRQADAHLCFTERDRAGLAALLGSESRITGLPPFVDVNALADVPSGRRSDRPVRLLTVAMMRFGDKLESYRFLARALAQMPRSDWELTIVGDGPARADVVAAFSGCPGDRLIWRGTLPREGVTDEMADADLFVWPGFGEAFGLAYLEAQALGAPVVALDVAGVSSVVETGQTGILVQDCNERSYGEAMHRLIENTEERLRLGKQAARFVRSERTVEQSSAIIDQVLRRLVEQD